MLVLDDCGSGATTFHFCSAYVMVCRVPDVEGGMSAAGAGASCAEEGMPIDGASCTANF